ncbi:MAG TPA: hypothetical protein VLZ50_00715 [Terracidiphilus sp.]|nr:hypothetical protein [Terracidiphilus sp.]
MYRHHHLRAGDSAAASHQFTRLPFALPCSMNTADVSQFYAALRRRDRAQVTRMFAADTIHMIPKDTPLSIVAGSPFAMITTEDKKQATTSCFIPGDVLPAIERKAYH